MTRIFQILPVETKAILRQLRPLIITPLKKVRYAYLKREPTLENLNANAEYFSKSYTLAQTGYFLNISNYGQDINFRKELGVNKEYLPLWNLVISSVLMIALFNRE